MEWYMLYVYNINNGSRGILSLVNAPFRPSNRFPFYYGKPIFAKWIKAVDVDIISSGCKVEFRRSLK